MDIRRSEQLAGLVRDPVRPGRTQGLAGWAVVYR
jgi:hypothetical protein